LSTVRALLIAAALSLALPAASAAKLQPYIPPGNSGANEYIESVPTAAGDNATGNVIQSEGTGSSLPPSTQSALVSQGRDGRATAALANATAPAKLRNHRRHVAAGGGGGGSTGAGSSGAPPSSGGSPAASVLKSLFGLQGQGGALLPVILILAALALGAERMWRRRTS
jgi:hypothetical protein